MLTPYQKNMLSTVLGMFDGSTNVRDANLFNSVDNYFTGNLDYARELENFNIQSAFNSAEAVKNRQWQERMYEVERLYNSAEAEKNRQWQEDMSSTSYQRVVEDMKKAGLNPYLALNLGGASTPSGSTASVSMPTGSSASASSPHSSTKASKGVGAVFNAITSIVNSATMLASSGISSLTSLANTAYRYRRF